MARVSTFTDSKVVYKVAYELKRRYGATNFEIAKQMNIKRSSFYNILKKHKGILDF